MSETTPPKLTDGSLYVFRIGYHLPGSATLYEEYRDTDLAAAINYAQGRMVARESTDDPFAPPTSETILIPQGEGRIGAIRRSNVLYVSAEHAPSNLVPSAKNKIVPRWRIVRPGEPEDLGHHGSHDDAGEHVDSESEDHDSSPGSSSHNDPADDELRMGYAKGYERGVDDIMARCEVLLKETAVLNVLRRHAFARREAMTALIRRAKQDQNARAQVDANGPDAHGTAGE